MFGASHHETVVRWVKTKEIRGKAGESYHSTFDSVVMSTIRIGENTILVPQTTIASDGWVLNSCKSTP